jgi:ubiquinone/menaquinone biosynthesis C-methylase UbiE
MPGYRVLDYGCGPGSYVKAVAELVGNAGKVYALDAHPLAIKMVKDMISKKHFRNVETIFSECLTGLPENSVDIVLLYDTLHDLEDFDCILSEIHRILKPDGFLSLSDHHLMQDEIVTKVTLRGLFKLILKGKRTYSFAVT